MLRTYLLFTLYNLLGTLVLFAHPADQVFQLGGTGTEVQTVVELSDKTILLAGGTPKLDWLPSTVKPIALGNAELITSAPSGRQAFLLHVSADLSQILSCHTLPADKAGDINYIKSTNIPGQKTGALYLSGTRVGVEKDKTQKPGYYLAKLDANFVDAVPTKLLWVENIWAEGECGEKQPWDVFPDGRVLYASGGPHGYDWFSVNALDANGKPTVIEDWRTHWYLNSEGKESEWAGTPASKCPHGKVFKSGIVLKVWGRGDFRSWTQADYDLWTPDGNGGQKKGAWPYDAFFAGPFNPADPNNSPKGRGYTGYGWPGTPCGNMQAIHIDRRSGEIYLGGNHKSALPKGPDFEPFVVAMTSTGKLKWWMRLYKEVPPAAGKSITDDQDARLSTPDQYIDALTIDYSQPVATGALVVVARCHGNNVVNFWKGNEIKHPKNPGGSFQSFFTGSNGNIHYGWIGRLATTDGTMLHSTFVGEYSEGAKVGKKSWDDPNLDGWPRFDSAWPDINTTRLQPVVQVNSAGDIYIIGTGRRPITTANAWQKNVKPNDGKGAWQNFVRGYSADLTTLCYSSIMSGPWDTTTGNGAADVELNSVFAVSDGVLVVGLLKASKDGTVTPIPTQGVPAWGRPSKEAAGIVARLKVTK